MLLLFSNPVAIIKIKTEKKLGRYGMFYSYKFTLIHGIILFFSKHNTALKKKKISSNLATV